MSLFRSILVAADFSAPSKAAFQVACAIAHETTTRLFVLHVAEIAEGSAPSQERDEQARTAPDTTGEEPTRDESLIHRLREEYVPGRAIDIAFLVRDGRPANAILHEADQTGSELIVMGTHGRTGVLRLLAGSVAESVLRQAHRPVLALRSPESPLLASKPEVILHPTDLSEKSEAALRVARALARDRGARLILTHVLPVEVVPYGTVPVALDLPAVRATLEELGRSLDGPDMKYPVETQLVEGDAATVIVELAKDSGAHAIVMGSHARTGLSRLFLGSVAEAVLRKASCPVLVAKNPEKATSTPATDHESKHVIVI